MITFMAGMLAGAIVILIVRELQDFWATQDRIKEKSNGRED